MSAIKPYTITAGDIVDRDDIWDLVTDGQVAVYYHDQDLRMEVYNAAMPASQTDIVLAVGCDLTPEWVAPDAILHVEPTALALVRAENADLKRKLAIYEDAAALTIERVWVYDYNRAGVIAFMCQTLPVERVRAFAERHEPLTLILREARAKAQGVQSTETGG